MFAIYGGELNPLFGNGLAYANKIHTRSYAQVVASGQGLNTKCDCLVYITFLIGMSQAIHAPVLQNV